MNKTEFFEKHKELLISVAHDDSGYGDFLILHPQEVDFAQRLQKEGYRIVSVHETEDNQDYVDLSYPCDFADQPFKYGYFAIDDFQAVNWDITKVLKQ